MAIDLKKLYSDIQTEDDDMKVLSMRTIKRLNDAVISRNVPIILQIREQLQNLSDDGSDEIRFFADEAIEYLDSFKDILKTSRKDDLDSSQRMRTVTPSAPSETAQAQAKPAGTPVQSVSGLSAPSQQALKFLAQGTSKPGKAIAALNMLTDVSVKHLSVVRKYLRFKVPQVRLAAAKVIISSGDERTTLEALLPHINDRSQEVRELCLKGIMAMEPVSLFSAIETMLRAQQISVKVAAVFILAHMKGDEVIRLLELAAHDTNEEVRLKVVDALKGRTGWDVLAILKRLVNDLDIDVAEKALVLYEKLKELEGIENSSAEFSDVIMEKLNEIKAQQDMFESEESSFASADVPDTSGDRVKVGKRTSEMQAYAVPKKITGSSKFSEPQDFQPQEPLVSDEPTEEGSEILKSISEYPEDVQLMSDEIYDRLDMVLEDMGRKIWKLEKSNRISNRRFSKIVYDIQKYEDMLAKRKEKSEVKDGFFAKLSAGNRMVQEKQQAHLEFSLAELYRKLGEIAVEISISEDSRFSELEDYYTQVDDLLSEVHSIKEMHEL